MSNGYFMEEDCQNDTVLIGTTCTADCTFNFDASGTVIECLDVAYWSVWGDICESKQDNVYIEYTLVVMIQYIHGGFDMNTNCI